MNWALHPQSSAWLNIDARPCQNCRPLCGNKSLYVAEPAPVGNAPKTRLGTYEGSFPRTGVLFRDITGFSKSIG